MNEEEYKFEFALEVLNHLGRQLYRSFSTVVSEAVSNSWDAGATEVKIDINQKDCSMTITDNGIGMSSDDFREKFLTVGYSRREGGGASSLANRPPHGRKGIGKLALLSVSDKLTVITQKKGNDVVGGTLNNKTLDKYIERKEKVYNLEPLRPEEKSSASFIGKQGTILKFEAIKPRFNSPDKMRAYMALAFSFSPGSKNLNDKFDIYVNGNLVERKHDLKDLDRSTEMLWIFDKDFDVQSTFSDELKVDFKERFSLEKLNFFRFVNDQGQSVTAQIGGYVASVQKPSQLQVRGTGGGDEPFKAGVHLYTNGRLRQFNILEVLRSTKLVPSYLYGEIHVDMFDTGRDTEKDMFTSSREGILEDNPQFQSFKETLDKILRQIINDWSARRNRALEKPVGDIHRTMKSRFSKAMEAYINADAEDLEEKDKKAIEAFKIFSHVSDKSEDEEKAAREKSVLICHSSKDSQYADFVFHMLLHLGLTPEEIIYSSAKDIDSEKAARLPVDDFMEYLKSFFKQHIYSPPAIILMHSNKLKTWHPTIEVGASWIAGTDDRIIQVIHRNKNSSRVRAKIEPPLTQRDTYLDLEEKIDSGRERKFTFNNVSRASQWFRKLVNFCNKRRGKAEVPWDEDEFQKACDTVNEKLRSR